MMNVQASGMMANPVHLAKFPTHNLLSLASFEDEGLGGRARSGVGTREGGKAI